VKVGDSMKLVLSETEYEQLAIEKFQKIMKDVPIVSKVETSLSDSRNKFGDFHVLVHFKDDRDPIKFTVEVKSNGEKRFVNDFIAYASQNRNNVYYVFMAPYVSKSSADTIIQSNLSYIDLSGNCYIATRHIIIVFSGMPNLYKDQRQKRDYFSKKASAASAVLRTMLSDMHAVWTIKSLSETTGKALGTVYNVKKFMLEQDWIKKYPHGFTVQNADEIVRVWAEEYHMKPQRAIEYYSLNSVPQIESEIASCNAIQNTNAVLGNFSAAARYAPTVRYNKVHVYVEQKSLDVFVKQLKLKPVSSGGNVIIIIPHDVTPCMFTQIINGNLITSPVQTVIDLLGSSGRGEEAAEAIIQKELK